MENRGGLVCALQHIGVGGQPEVTRGKPDAAIPGIPAIDPRPDVAGGSEQA